MALSKDQWNSRIEQVEEELTLGQLDRRAFLQSLNNLGFSWTEAEARYEELTS